MSRNPASEFDLLRAKLWVRFLLVCLNCDARWLDRSLLLPLTDKTGLLSERLAPRVFATIYSAGKNPNGAYWKEFDDSGDRFNLVDRVADRVPRSKQWLLSEFTPYLKDDPPSLGYSHQFIQSFLRARRMRFVPATVMRNIEKMNPAVENDLCDGTLVALINDPTPDRLMLMIAILHQLTWHRNPSAKIYQEFVLDAAGVFCESLFQRKFDDAAELGTKLFFLLSPAIRRIGVWGDRTLPSDRQYGLEEIPDYPVLVEDSDDITDACYCLFLHSPEWQFMNQEVAAKYPWFREKRWFPSADEIEAAADVIQRSADKAVASLSKEYSDSLLHSSIPTNSGKAKRNANHVNTDNARRRNVTKGIRTKGIK